MLYRTTPLFLKLFGLDALEDLPDPSEWDPTPEEEAELRDRLLRAGEQRAGGAATPMPEPEPSAPAAASGPSAAAAPGAAAPTAG